jgi:hypothetical protein
MPSPCCVPLAALLLVVGTFCIADDKQAIAGPESEDLAKLLNGFILHSPTGDRRSIAAIHCQS